MVNIDIRPFVGNERCYNIEVLACKIAEHKHESIVLDFKEESRDIAATGLETAVQNICDSLRIPYEQVEFRSCDRLLNGTVFAHKLNEHLLWFYPCMTWSNARIDIPRHFKYGMFLGRPCNERLYSFHKHWTWPYKNLGLASQHLNLEIENESTSDYTGFICEHHDKWQQIRPVLPYSDLNDNYTYKDMSGAVDSVWQEYYKDFAVEIVLETMHTEKMFFLSEKTFRPINHGRLFLIIGSPQVEKNLQSLGFDIFEDIIDKSYDNLSSYMRVDAVFRSLAQLLENPVDFEKLLPRLEKNRLLVEQMKQHDPALDKDYVDE